MTFLTINATTIAMETDTAVFDREAAAIGGARKSLSDGFAPAAANYDAEEKLRECNSNARLRGDFFQRTEE